MSATGPAVGLLPRLLVRTLPAHLRAEHGDEIAVLLAERLAAARDRGPIAWLRTSLSLLVDSLRTGLRGRLGGGPSRHDLPGQPSPGWSPDMLFQDLKFGARMLAHRPGFAAAVIVTLALGIGANALIYSVVDAVVLRPFDFPEPDRVLAVGVAFPRLGSDLGFFEAISAPEWTDLRDQSRTLEDVVAFDMGNRQLMGGDEPTNLFTAFWWGDPLAAAGLTPVVGRSFTQQEIDGRERVALISERVWRGRFGGDAEIAGRAVRINDDPYVIIGVFPEAANFYGTDLWTPMWAMPNEMPRQRRQFNILARPAAGVTLTEVNTELDTIARRTEQEYGGEFEEYAGWELRAMTWTDANVRTLRPAALILLGSVGFVLLLVCANVASLLLSRSTGRQRELALRAALGARRGRVFRQLMAESLLVSVLGLVVGLGIAWLGLQWVTANVPANLLPTTRAIALNLHVLAYAAVVAIGAGLVFGMAPALSAARVDLQGALQTGGNAGATRGRRRLQDVFVVVEVALALALLAGAGLFLTSFARLQRIDPGIDAENVLTMRLTLPWSRYDGPGITAFFEDLATSVESIPGVEAATTMSQFPPIGFSTSQFSIPDRPTAEDERLPTGLITIVGDDALPMLGVPLRAGRLFGPQDTHDVPFVAVVNETFARALFGDESVIGKRIQLGAPGDNRPVLEIVGVVADTRNSGLDAPTRGEVYVNLRQANGANNQFFLLVRAAGDPRSVLPAIREKVASIDPEQPVYSIATMRERFANGYAMQNFAMVLISAFALLALTLAAVGIGGIVSHTVASRTREIGVRMALGADRRAVRRLVVRQAMIPVLLGGLLGAALAAVVSLQIAAALPELENVEPGTLATVAVVLLAAAFIASVVPALRASRIDPVRALRTE